jgi:hypothetical protein
MQGSFSLAGDPGDGDRRTQQHREDDRDHGDAGLAEPSGEPLLDRGRGVDDRVVSGGAGEDGRPLRG